MAKKSMNVSFSFKKKGTEVRRIPGTKFSYRKAQLITSTGNPSFNSCLGGALAVGSVLLVEEEFSDLYSKQLLRCYLGEAVTNSHSIFLATTKESELNILEHVPVERKKNLRRDWSPDELNIAWRYKNRRIITDSNDWPSLFTQEYDLSESVNLGEVKEKVFIVKYCASTRPEESGDASAFINEHYSSILRLIKKTLEKKFYIKSDGERGLGQNLLRIAVTSVGSPVWQAEEDTHSLLRFLYVLRSLLRSTYAVAFLTVPSGFVQDAKLREKIYQMSDYVVRIIPFPNQSENKNPMTKDFQGLFEVKKLLHLNSPMYQNPLSDLAFQVNKKTFKIRRLHLPPCVEDPSNDDTSHGCGVSSKHLEF